MTFEQAQLSLQLMAEERVGAPMRSEAWAAKHREDAAAQAAIAAVSGS